MLLPSQIHIPKSRWIIVLSVCAILIGLCFSGYLYLEVDAQSRIHITDRTNTLAEAISGDTIKSLSGSPEDLANPAYIALKQFLINIQKVNHDVRFVYVIGKHDTQELFFYADSEDPTSVDYSPPGQTYDEAPYQMYQTFGEGMSNTDGPTRDRWGIWVSGYSPIFDSNHTVVALVGMDIPATAYITNGIVYAMLPLLVTLIFVVVLLIGSHVRRKERQYIAQKAEFLSIAAHEIRTPLVGIKWALESILSHIKGFDQKTQQITVLAEQNTAKLLDRINNLLTVTRFESGAHAVLEKTWTPLLPLLNEIIDSLKLTAHERDISIVFETHLSMTDGIWADSENIRYAFSNLISNAVKYTNAHTTITIRLDITDSKCIFSVTDQGNGISLTEQAHIFDGYHRTSGAIASKQYGTGLGLYLTKKIIETHGGTISIFSIQKQGTTFTCTLPLNK